MLSDAAKKGLFACQEMVAADIFDKADITEKIIDLQEYIKETIVSMRETLKK